MAVSQEDVVVVTAAAAVVGHDVAHGPSNSRTSSRGMGHGWSTVPESVCRCTIRCAPLSGTWSTATDNRSTRIAIFASVCCPNVTITIMRITTNDGNRQWFPVHFLVLALHLSLTTDCPIS